jgi:hypothetical protein
MAERPSPAHKSKDGSVPVLITWDIDPDQWIPGERRRWALDTAMDLCHRQGIRATFFFTALSAELYHDKFEKLRVHGHEIGCHGLTHGNEENYDRMSKDMQRRYISEAKEKLQELTGDQVHSFRSPRVKTSAATLRLLAEQEYLADSSVCSQRIDFISSNLINIGWVFSPRHPYQPNRNSAFKQGDVPIWEMPISAMVVPFISSTLKVFGLPPMEAFFKLLYTEARWTGKPIVYLAHPAEFIVRGPEGRRYSRSWKAQTKLYLLDAKGLFNASQELFAYMASFPDVTFLTVEEYVIHHLGKAS